MLHPAPKPAADAAPPQVSVVLPLHDEEANIGPLIDELTRVLAGIGRSYELMLVDDGSTDRTPSILAELAARDPRVRVVRLRRNFGQTAALAAGFDHARGDVIVSLDGDGQHDPDEIPFFLAKIDEGFDLVSGWRTARPDDHLLTRRLPSRAANAAMAVLSGLPLHDFGTTFKAYRRRVLADVELYGDFHRFIPALLADTGARMCEIPIRIRPRKQGRSHYGLLRTVTVFFDLIRIRFLTLYLSRPLQLFGGAGLALAGLGGAVMAWLIWLRLFHDVSLLGHRWPLFTIATFAVLLGAQLFCLGLLGEIIVRLYFGLKVKKPYVVDRVL